MPLVLLGIIPNIHLISRFFVEGRSTYLIYRWEMLGHNGLLGFSVQCLNEDISSGNGDAGVPSAIGHKHSFYDDLALSSSRGPNKKDK